MVTPGQYARARRFSGRASRSKARAARTRSRGARAAHIGAGYAGAVRGRKPSRVNNGHTRMTFR
ncbi:hypothetical protein GCM10010279_10610 [Streptomyces mutabilis]|nr:hypothetical protein GCM10010279_10610 [Streptomyces mutabilis]